jgi:hypothetical protein
VGGAVPTPYPNPGPDDSPESAAVH